MDMKKFLMGTIAGGVSYFFLGYLIYGMALTDFMAAHSGSASGVMRADMDLQFWSIALGNLLTAALLTMIFLRWANVSSFGGGASAGASIGILMAAGIDFTMYGTSNVMDLTAVCVDIVAATIMTGIVGGVIGAVLGMGTKSA